MTLKRTLAMTCVAGSILFSATPHTGMAQVPAAVLPRAHEPRTSLFIAPCFTSLAAVPECSATLATAMTRAEKVAFLQDEKGVPRLGIPSLDEDDGPNGVRGFSRATAFPAAVAVAASFDPGLAHAYGVAIGTEQRQAGHNVYLGPTINILRNWRWGRSAETLGEDPYLAGIISRAEIDGVQEKHVIAMVKHFVANSQEAYRFGEAPDDINIDEHIDPGTLNALYYPAFRAALAQGGAAAAMCAYPMINGEHPCESATLMGTLRALGLDGFIEADAVRALHDGASGVRAGMDRLSKPLKGPALAQMVASGAVTDTALTRMATNMLRAMRRVRIGMVEDVPADWPARDAALATRIGVEGMVLLRNDGVLPLASTRFARGKTIAVIGENAAAHGAFEEAGSPYVNTVEAADRSASASILTAVAARARAAGMRVTYTEGDFAERLLTPIPASVFHRPDGRAGLSASYMRHGTQAVLTARTEAGVDLDEKVVPARIGKLKHNYDAVWEGTITAPRTGTYRITMSGQGTARLEIAGKIVTSIFSADFSTIRSGEVALKANRPVPIRVTFDARDAFLHGARNAMFGNPPPLLHLSWAYVDPDRLTSAVAAARAADVVVVVGGDWESEGVDRPAMALPVGQDPMIAAVAAANPRTVVVLNTGGPVAMPWLASSAAVVEDWYLGAHGAQALASVLFGDEQPGGRLPMTFPREPEDAAGASTASYPGDGRDVQFTEGMAVGYRWNAKHGIVPLFPFGFGLGYGVPIISGVRLIAATGSLPARMTFTVRNQGARAMDVVPELYIAPPGGVIGLQAFGKFHIAPRGARAVSWLVTPAMLSTWDQATGRWHVPVGTYRLELGFAAGQPVTVRDLSVTHAVDLGPLPPLR